MESLVIWFETRQTSTSDLSYFWKSQSLSGAEIAICASNFDRINLHPKSWISDISKIGDKIHRHSAEVAFSLVCPLWQLQPFLGIKFAVIGK